MTQQFRITRYRPNDREPVLDFVRAVYSQPLADRLIRQWDWKYDRNPFNREAARYREAHREEVLGFLNSVFSEERFQKFCRKCGINPGEAVVDEGPYILLMKDGDEIVAMQGSIPQRFVIGGKERWASIGCDLVVHPDYRNRGLALPLTHRLLTEHAMMLSWFNASIHRIRSGWRKSISRRRGRSEVPGVAQRRLVALVKPIDLAYAVGMVTGSRMLADAMQMMASAARPLTKILARRGTIPGVSVAEIDLPGDEFDKLWIRIRDTQTVIGVRDRRFLNWRFVDRPDASYRFLVAVRDSKMIGYLVFRVAEIEGATWGYLVDFMVEYPSRRAFTLLVQGAEDCLVRAGAKVILCDAATSPYRSALIRRGYLPSPGRKAIYLSANLNSADAELRPFADLPHWFVTAADGNLDMAF
jgi:hypothetical protein